MGSGVKFLIDTNIAIHARDGQPAVVDRLGQCDGIVFLSALSLAELQRGLLRGPDPELRRTRMRIILEAVPILPFDASAAETYGRVIREAWLGFRRCDFDRMIGAHALSAGCTLATANLADFSDIPGLSIENWTLGE